MEDDVIFKLKNKLNVETKILIYQSLIQSHLNYMAIAYAYNKHSNLIKSLQHMQNRALKIVYNLPASYSTISLYKDICPQILPIQGLYKYQVLMFVFNCIHNIGYHTISFLKNQFNVNTRKRTNIRVPLCRLGKTKQRIDYIGAVVYKNLPTNVKSIDQIGAFKSSSKQYIYESVETLLT